MLVPMGGREVFINHALDAFVPGRVHGPSFALCENIRYISLGPVDHRHGCDNIQDR